MNGEGVTIKESTKELFCHVSDLNWRVVISAKTIVQLLFDYCSMHVGNGEVLGIDETAGLVHVLKMLGDKIDLINEALGNIGGEIFRLEPLEG